VTNRVDPGLALRVRAEADGVEVNHGLIAVIPLSAMISSSVCGSVTSACASSICSAAAIAVSTIVVVSPASAPCKVGRHLTGGDSRDYCKLYCVFSIA